MCICQHKLSLIVSINSVCDTSAAVKDGNNENPTRLTLRRLTAFSVIMVIFKHYECPLLLYRLFQIYPAKNNPPLPVRGIKLC